MALRNTLLAQIFAAIEHSAFTVADFEVTQEVDDDLLRIQFLHHKEYVFQVVGTRSGYYTIEAPGEHQKQEDVPLPSLSAVPARVTAWIRHIREEMRAALPVYSELDELRVRLEEHIKNHIEYPEAKFSPIEEDDLSAKLDELAGRFKVMQEKSELTEKELSRLNQEIENIKSNLSIYPKGMWYKTAANRLWAVTSKIATSQESRQVLAKAAQKMLGIDG